MYLLKAQRKFKYPNIFWYQYSSHVVVFKVNQLFIITCPFVSGWDWRPSFVYSPGTRGSFTLLSTYPCGKTRIWSKCLTR